jgi:maltose alpha-D-glucosyltransferase/alpha-amylase
MERWANFWQMWVSAGFLQAYLEVAFEGTFLPKNEDEMEILLDAFCLEKAVYELGYELNNRPQWVKLPIQGIFQLLQVGETK